MPHPLPALSPALRRAHNASLQRMVAVEKAVRTTLGATARRAAQAGASSSGGRIERVMEGGRLLEAGVGLVMVRARETARREGRATFLGELSAATAGGSDRWEAPAAPEGQGEQDEAAATVAAKAFAAGWLSEALANVARPDAEQADVLAEMIAATAAQGYRLDAMAASDVAATYNAEREELGAAYAQDAGRLWLPIPLKYWDATLDTKLCARCAALHGTTRPLGFPFPGGLVPGAVHRNCRCGTGLTGVIAPLPAGEGVEEADYYFDG